MTTSKLLVSMAMAAGLVAAGAGQVHAQNSPQAANGASATSAAPAANSVPASAPTSAKATATGTAAEATGATAASKQTTTGSPTVAQPQSNAQSSDDGLPVEVLKEARDDGFRPITHGKATLYCKSEIIVGSSFPVRTCYNADRLKIVLQQYQDQRMQLQQMHNTGTQSQ